MPKLSTKTYRHDDLVEVAARISRQAAELERVAKFLKDRDIESVSINYGAGLSQALHKIALFIGDADRSTLDEIME